MKTILGIVGQLIHDSGVIFAAALVVVTVVLFTAIALQVVAEVWQIVTFLI